MKQFTPHVLALSFVAFIALVSFPRVVQGQGTTALEVVDSNTINFKVILGRTDTVTAIQVGLSDKCFGTPFPRSPANTYDIGDSAAVRKYHSVLSHFTFQFRNANGDSIPITVRARDSAYPYTTHYYSNSKARKT